ncbi:MAG: zinc-dependent alcohol dehydrogenase family protein, partial [Candidatus Acidiferrales bacterium]
CLLRSPAPVETNPLQFTDVPVRTPAPGEVLVRVKMCGVCRTDLHVVEGELPPRKSPVIPGHQIVGVVEKLGEGSARFKIGARVGIAWLHQTDGTCEYCRAGTENLCDHPTFTGYSVDGGYAECAVAPQDFVYALPENFADEHAAPLLCAGIIGFRCLRLSNLKRGGRLAFYGFGAAAHVAIQVALHWGIEVYACTRGKKHQQLALQLGSVWAGEASEQPPKQLDAGIIFAPAGELVPPALKALKKGGVLVLGGIHMSPIPSFDYDLLYQERMIRSVANNTRKDGEDFLRVAAEIPIHSQVTVFPLREANRALNDLKSDRINGAAVLDCNP